LKYTKPKAFRETNSKKVVDKITSNKDVWLDNVNGRVRPELADIGKPI
jgi:hypothetical protein